MNSIGHEQRSHEACKKCVFFWPPKKPQRVLILQDERRLDGSLGSTPSPSARDGEPLLHEVGRAHDSATRKIKKTPLCTPCCWREDGLDRPRAALTRRFLVKTCTRYIFSSHAKVSIFVFELNPKCSNTRRRRIAARSRESTRQHRTHASKMPLCTPCCWRDDGLNRPRVALTRRLSKSVYFSWARKSVKILFLSSTPSPRTPDGEQLLLEVVGMRDSTARIPKGGMCAHRAVGAKTGLIGRKQRSH